MIANLEKLVIHLSAFRMGWSQANSLVVRVILVGMHVDIQGLKQFMTLPIRK